jgi:undecaprenyl-diphosphatase
MGLLLNILKSLIYGIIQGITEWLPISSTGHLIMMRTFMPLNVYADAAMNDAFWNMYKVVIQFGSILAVILLYFYRLNPFNSKLRQKQKTRIWRLWIMILIASVPTAVIGLLLDDWVDAKMNTPVVIAVMLIVYGILFILIENMNRPVKVRHTGQITVDKALLTGLFQSLALIPGTSRSGATILGETLIGFDRPAAAEFSFFLAIPTMFGASLLKLIKMKISLNAGAVLVLLAGLLSAFIVSVIVIRKLITYLRTHDFKIFGVYRILLGAVVLIFALLKVL